jgi:hypothetical protein
LRHFLQKIWKTRGHSQRVYQPFATYSFYGNREADCVCRGTIRHEVTVFIFIFLSIHWRTVPQLAKRRDMNLTFVGKARALWFWAQSQQTRLRHSFTQRYLMNHRGISEHRSVILVVYIPT